MQYVPYLFLACVVSSGAGVIGYLVMNDNNNKKGDVCIPVGGPSPVDINATYKYDEDGDCNMSCNTGYIEKDGFCVVELPSGRYVKLIQTIAQDLSLTGLDNQNKVLNIAELEVFDRNGATSIAAGKTVTGSSQHSATHGYINLVDGNTGNFAHTKGRTATEFDYLQVDLGSVQEIEKIKIINRTGQNRNRAIGVKAVILGGDGTTVIRETPAITTAADTYIFTFPGTTWV
jgi:hypothetical protein